MYVTAFHMGKVVLSKQMLNVRNAYEHEKFDTKVDDEMEYTNPNASPIPNFPDVPFSIRQELLSLPCLYALTLLDFHIRIINCRWGREKREHILASRGGKRA